MVLWLVASAALAQDPSSRLNSQLFRPAFDSEGTLWTEDARVRPDGYGTVRSFFQYANAPFRYRDASGDVTRAVSDLAERCRRRGGALAEHLPKLRLSVSEIPSLSCDRLLCWRDLAFIEEARYSLITLDSVTLSGELCD